ncbi:MAG: hypothetical protein JSV96_00055, partial [Candidatus Aminicenantes bacterium]
KCAQSLSQIEDINECNIRVYDDCSTEYGKKFLEDIFPEAKEIVVREKNLRADRNMALMFRNFLDTQDDYMLIADSDLIFRSDIIKVIKKVIPGTDGILSLYNSTLHDQIVGSQDIKGIKVLKKKDLGAAGTVLSREVVKRISGNINDGDSYDWRWSEFLLKEKLRMFCTEDSYLQHIGFEGQNNDGLLYDFGKNFYPGNRVNEEIMADYIETALGQIVDHAKFVLENNLEHKIGYWITNPYPALKELIKRLFKKVK